MSAIKIPSILHKSYSDLPSNEWSFNKSFMFLDLTKKSFKVIAQKVACFESSQSEIVLTSVVFNINSKNGPIEDLTAQKISDLAQIILGKDLNAFCENDGTISIRPRSAHVNTKSQFYDVNFENSKALKALSDDLLLALGENYSISVKTDEY